MFANIIELKNISLRRDNCRLLKGVDWTVKLGEHWAVIGPNGCGKTTMLRIVAGWMFPSTGTAKVCGMRFGQCRMDDVKRRIGWVSSALETMMRPRLQARGVVLGGLKNTLGIWEKPTPEELKKADAMLEWIGCAHRATLPFCLLSQGEQMKVMIARALIPTPELLILDEPCVGLDPVARQDVLEIIDSLADDRHTILYVTHHIEEIVPTLTHVLALRDGTVAAQGEKDQVLNNETLSNVFDRTLRVETEKKRYRLSLH
jgi:iron complex transport system ATP-binding protein